MKKILTLVVLLFALTTVVDAQIVKLGIQGGVSMNKMNVNDIPNTAVKNFTGFYVGPVVEVRIPLAGLSLDGSVQYSQAGGKFWKTAGDKVTETKVTQNSISLPVTLKQTFGLSSLCGFYIGAGPQFDWLLGDKAKATDLGTFTMNSSAVSANISAGIRAFNTLQLGLTYNIGLSKGTTYETAKYNSNIWKVNMIVFF